MALGTLTIVESAAAAGGPVFVYRCTLVGDSSYPTGGTTGLLAKLRTAASKPSLNILSVQGEGDNGDRHLEYVHSSEKLFVRVMSTGADTANATNESGTTYGLTIWAT